LKILVNEVNGKRSGVMVPIPQYPLYSATLAEFNMHQVCASIYLAEFNMHQVCASIY
jgi:alanine transaminase